MSLWDLMLTVFDVFVSVIPVQSLAQVRPQLESQSNDRQRDAVLDDGRLGLRGLYNLGNTFVLLLIVSKDVFIVTISWCDVL
jgi:hypothetical protein